MGKDLENNRNNAPKDISEQLSYDDNLADQKRRDALRDQENMRKWVEEDVKPPVKMSCKISKHVVSNNKSVPK